MWIYIENLKIAAEAVLTNKLRSFLTILGVVIGVFSVIMIIAIVTGLKDEIRSQIVSLGGDILDIIPSKVENLGPGSGQIFATFEKDEIDTLKEEAKLYRYITEVYENAGNYEYRDKTQTGFIIGANPSYFKIRERKARVGTLFEKKDMHEAKRVVVIGTNVAKELFGGFERSLDKKIKINGKEFRVIGVLEKEDFKMGSFDINDAVYIPSTTARTVFDGARLAEVLVKTHSEEDIDEAAAEIEKILNRVRGKDKFSILTQDDMLKVVDQITALITTALAGLASISLLVGGIGIMNIMLVSVTERTKEIGIRKAVGAENSHILIQFLTESVVLSLFGGFLGLLIAYVASLIINKFTGITSLINAQTVSGAIGFSVFVGVIFGTAPAYKASQKDPIESLRYE